MESLVLAVICIVSAVVIPLLYYYLYYFIPLIEQRKRYKCLISKK